MFFRRHSLVLLLCLSPSLPAQVPVKALAQAPVIGLTPQPWLVKAPALLAR